MNRWCVHLPGSCPRQSEKVSDRTTTGVKYCLYGDDRIVLLM
jgi:hypothetical protein